MLVVVLIAILTIVIPATAGGPPVFCVSVPTGIFAPWGQELVHDTMLWVTPEPTYLENFAHAWSTSYNESSSWAGMRFVGDEDHLLYSGGSLHEAPIKLEGILWSGLAENRETIPVNVSMYADPIFYGNPWGAARRFSIFGADGALLRETVLRPGDTYSTTLAPLKAAFAGDATNGYIWQLQAVPEPSSLMALGALLVPGMLSMRRRK